MGAVPSYILSSSTDLQLDNATIEKQQALYKSLAGALETQNSLDSIFDQHVYRLYELNADVVNQMAPHYDAVSFLDYNVQELSSWLNTISQDDSTLEKVFKNSFTIYRDILKAGNFKHAIPQVNEVPPYQDYIDLLESRQPTAQLYLNAGLEIAMSRMLFDLHEAHKVLNKKRVEELVKFLTDAIITYGAYCIMLGYWEPDEDDTSDITESIRLYHNMLKAEPDKAEDHSDTGNSLLLSLAEEDASLYSSSSNIQRELLNLYAQNIPDQDLQNIKDLIANYFAEKAMDLADQVWEEKGWSEDDSHRLANTRMRTPYNSQNE